MNKKEKAIQLRDQIEENETFMAEAAAYQAACEMLGIDPDDGYEIMSCLDEDN
tara:strand:+ start:51523 stop:51681 length:159 start_codon:yes stop_codon:yes gene_type:complete